MASALVPRPETFTAVGVITVVYLLRIASIGTPAPKVAWPLYLTTDLILPAAAGAWLFVVSTYILIIQFDDDV